jgi:hypothetical protein
VKQREKRNKRYKTKCRNVGEIVRRKMRVGIRVEERNGKRNK